MAAPMAGVTKAQIVRVLAESYPDDHAGWARWLDRMTKEELRRLAAKRGVALPE